MLLPCLPLPANPKKNTDVTKIALMVALGQSVAHHWTMLLQRFMWYPDVRKSGLACQLLSMRILMFWIQGVHLHLQRGVTLLRGEAQWNTVHRTQTLHTLHLLTHMVWQWARHRHSQSSQTITFLVPPSSPLLMLTLALTRQWSLALAHGVQSMKRHCRCISLQNHLLLVHQKTTL